MDKRKEIPSFLGRRNLLLGMAFLLSFCSFTYELTIAKSLHLLTGSSILWQSVTIGIYIAFLGVGSICAERLLQRNVLGTLIKVEIALSVLGGLSAILIVLLHSIYRVESSSETIAMITEGQRSLAGPPRGYFVAFVACSQLITAIVGFLSGIEVPALLKLSARGVVRENTILALNYIGVLFASLAFALYLQPVLDIAFISLLLGALNLLACLLLILGSPRGSAGRLWMSLPVAGLFLIAGALWSPNILQTNLKIFYYYRYPEVQASLRAGDLGKFVSSVPTVERAKSIYQKIDKVFIPHASADQSLIVYLDGHFQFSSRTEAAYHEAITHIPILLAGRVPDRALVLGAGDGLLIKQLLKYGSQIAAVKHIELDKKMYDMAVQDPDFTALNDNALRDPKVTTVFEDAFYHLRHSTEQHDSVFIDFPYPYDYDLARLYSVEFFKMLHKRLSADGFGVIDVPIYGADDVKSEQHKRINSIMLSTMREAGFETIFPYEVKKEGFIFFSKRKLEPQLTDENPYGITYHGIDRKTLQDIGTQIFPHEVHDRYVNSIFHPTLIDLTDSSF